jgi:hypothetical protein
VRADVIDMGRNFSLNVNGQPRQVPIGDIVLIDFAGDGRSVTWEEVSKVNAANGGYVIMRNGEQFNASLQDFTGKPLIAVFSNGRRSNISDVARIYLGSVGNVPGFPTAPPAATVAPNTPMPEAPPWTRPRPWPSRRRSDGGTRECAFGRRAVERAVDKHWVQCQPRPVSSVRAVGRDSTQHEW